MSARFLVGDVFDRLAEIETGSVDLVVTSPPFLALRSYLPADHPDKSKEIGSESTPAQFIDVMLRVTQELRRVLAPHGSICIELGDTYAGSGGAGGDYDEDGLRAGQPRYKASDARKNARIAMPDGRTIQSAGISNGQERKGAGWPLAKSKALIAELYRIGLAYGINPLTGSESPAGRWRVRNVVTWVRPNPPVGALGDKWRPATSDLVVACTSPKRYWDDLATRRPHRSDPLRVGGPKMVNGVPGVEAPDAIANSAGAPLLDWWEIPPGGYKGSHYAVFPDQLVVPCVQAMCPPKVCRTCGEPSRRIVGEPTYVDANGHDAEPGQWVRGVSGGIGAHALKDAPRLSRRDSELGWSDCGHDDYRPGLILDPFAGSGTTLAVATGYGHDAIGIDLDQRNADLALERVGPFLLEVV